MCLLNTMISAGSLGQGQKIWECLTHGICVPEHGTCSLYRKITTARFTSADRCIDSQNDRQIYNNKTTWNGGGGGDGNPLVRQVGCWVLRTVWPQKCLSLWQQERSLFTTWTSNIMKLIKFKSTWQLQNLHPLYLSFSYMTSDGHFVLGDI